MIYKTVIVEDDPMISQLNRSFIEEDKRFQVVGEFRDGRTALHYLTEHPVDLIILDVYMPQITGEELLKRLRNAETAADVIMVTAASDTKTVDTLLKLGVVDYLMKPFTKERFLKALQTFCRHREAVPHQNGTVSQEDLDAVFHPIEMAETLPKGFQPQTLKKLRTCLSQRGSDGCTCDALSSEAGLSTVTVRRYLNYLVEHGEAESTINYDTGGRPSVIYFAKYPT